MLIKRQKKWSTLLVASQGTTHWNYKEISFHLQKIGKKENVSPSVDKDAKQKKPL